MRSLREWVVLLHETNGYEDLGRHVLAIRAEGREVNGSEATGRLPIYYMAHSLSGDITGNLARAKRWYIYLSRALPSASIICPWVMFAELAADDTVPEDRQRGLTAALEHVRRCDGAILVGGRVSTGMSMEAGVAKQVHDLTHWGAEPPLGFFDLETLARRDS